MPLKNEEFQEIHKDGYIGKTVGDASIEKRAAKYVKRGPKNTKNGKKTRNKDKKNSSKGKKHMSKKSQPSNKVGLNQKALKQTKKGKKNLRDTSSAVCINNIVGYMRHMYIKVQTYKKQQNRITINLRVTSNKLGKRAQFAERAQQVLEAGGGDYENMKCKGLQETGSQNLRTLYDQLEKCDSDILMECEEKVPEVNETYIEICGQHVSNYELMVNKAMDTEGESSCGLWNHPD